jgi:hypothetical protein
LSPKEIHLQGLGRFPRHDGFSPRNLKYMRKFVESWPKPAIVQEVLAQITQSLPDELKSSLPTVEEIEAELERGLG